MNSFEKKFEDLNTLLTNLNQKLNNKCYERESLIGNKADAGDVVKASKRPTV